MGKEAEMDDLCEGNKIPNASYVSRLTFSLWQYMHRQSPLFFLSNPKGSVLTNGIHTYFPCSSLSMLALSSAISWWGGSWMGKEGPTGYPFTAVVDVLLFAGVRVCAMADYRLNLSGEK